MVGDPALREVVGANLRRTVAAADLSSPECALALLHLAHLALQKARPQYPQCLLLVLELTLLVLASHDQTRGLVRDPNRRVRRVHALTTRSARTVNVYLKIVWVDLGLYFLSLRQHGDRHRRGVNATLALGLRYPLNPVGSTLVLEYRVGSLTLDLGHNLFVASDLCRMRGEGAMFKAQTFGVAGIHLVEFAGEQSGLITASARPYLQDHVLVVVRVSVYKLGPDLLRKPGCTLLGHPRFLREKLPLFGRVGRRDQLPRLLGFLEGVEQLLGYLGTAPDAGVLPGNLGVAATVRVDIRV